MFLNNSFKLSEHKTISLSGLTDELLCIYLKKIVTQKEESILVLTSSIYEANKIFQSMIQYYPETYFFPMDDFLNSEAISLSPDLEITRVETLNSLVENGKRKILIANLMGYLRYLPLKNDWKDSQIHIQVGQKINKEYLYRTLIRMGYQNKTLVNKTSEVGNRGFILDVFPIGYENPVRIEFFGDEVDSLRIFNPDTQLSLNSIDNVLLKPTTEFIVSNDLKETDRKQKYLPMYTKNIDNILKYLENPTVVYVDYNQIKSAYNHLQEEIFQYNRTQQVQLTYMFDFEQIIPKKEIFYYKTDNLLPDLHINESLKFDSREIVSYNSDIEKIKTDLIAYIKMGKTVVLYFDDTYQFNSFKKSINLKFYLTDEEHILDSQINVVIQNRMKGYIFEKYVVLTPRELFQNSTVHTKYKSSIRYGLNVKDINKLGMGDYVVHYIHGVGIYQGITTLTKNGFKKDYLTVAYKNNEKLYIPVEKIGFLQKYSSHDGILPTVHHLGGTEWQKTKMRARNRIHDIASQLLKLSAEREILGGYAFPQDDDNQMDFEKRFPYVPTIDQLNASEQIKKEMESIHPMDVLLCGDVGYGKTEVAFRAIFKAINAGKQVAYLCPTTILANQQFENAIERFKEFPIKVGLLNRFVSRKKMIEVIKQLKEGKIDLVIGTHRLLSSDIIFNDLGLLVIDEEQRFGVTHKEKIKKLKQNVDVLTLSATPIPRTMQMAMSGIRKLCLIETPPIDRYPIQTYVLEENDYVIKDAIYKEISRNGQVFILYNRIEDIYDKVSYIQRLVKEAKITAIHGQMSKSEIENRMVDFISGRANVLVCTTIIETGIDIPNANTLIILNADKFGLSQLYQIRGRVGRSNKIAYAYLMYKHQKQLSEVASKRLSAIKEFTELGSGFFIAMRDLSIRGAGDVLGSEQAGFIDGVGIDLYLKMLSEEVAKIKGVPVDEVNQDNKPLLDVQTHIEDNYVLDEELKIEIHRRINEIINYTTLLEVKKELEDRFGALSEELLIYMYAEWFENLAKNLDIIRVQQTKNSVEFIFSAKKSEQLEINTLFIEANKISRMFRVGYQYNQIKLIIDTIKLKKHYLYYVNELLEKMMSWYN